MTKHTRPTPAGVPRGRSFLTRRERRRKDVWDWETCRKKISHKRLYRITTWDFVRVMHPDFHYGNPEMAKFAPVLPFYPNVVVQVAP